MLPISFPKTPFFNADTDASDGSEQDLGLNSDPEIATDSADSLSGHQVALNYRPELDGLRALAILPVLFYHFELGFPGGFVGVDVFFVISGYLITRILWANLTSRQSIFDFWIRRMRRLFPGLALMLAFTLLAGNFMFMPTMYTSLCRQTVAVLFLGANFYFYSLEDYFSDKHEFPLLHCWSLAVEEQFYLIYPILLVTFYKCKFGISGTVAVLTFITLISCGASIALVSFDHKFVFYLLPTRAWEMTLGALVAFCPACGLEAAGALSKGHELERHMTWKCTSQRINEMLSWLGISMIIIPFFVYPKPYALLPCIGAALFIWSQSGQLTALGQLAACRLLVFFGKISYALYLWHLPIYVLMISRSPEKHLPVIWSIFGMGVSMALAMVTYFGFEKVLRDRRRVPHSVFLVSAALVWLVLLSIAAASLSTPSGNRELGLKGCNKSTNVAFINNSVTSTCMVPKSTGELDHLYSIQTSAVTEATIMATQEWNVERYNQIAMFGPLSPTTSPSIVFIGSSHCSMYGNVLEMLAYEYNKTIGWLCRLGKTGRFGLPSFTGIADPAWDTQRFAQLQAWRPQLVVYLDCWSAWASILLNPSYPDIAYTFSLLLSVSERVLVFGTIPTLPSFLASQSPAALVQQTLNFHKLSGDWEFLINSLEDTNFSRLSVESNIQQVASSATFQGRVKFVEVASFFMDGTGHLQFVDPCTLSLSYRDACHLNQLGEFRLEGLFRKEIFGQGTCTPLGFV